MFYITGAENTMLLGYEVDIINVCIKNRKAHVYVVWLMKGTITTTLCK